MNMLQRSAAGAGKCLTHADTPLQPAERVIVFCNKIDTCRVVENALNRASGRAPEHGGGGGGGGGTEDDDSSSSRQHSDRGPPLTVLPYHAAITPPQRLANLQVQFGTHVLTVWLSL